VTSSHQGVEVETASSSEPDGGFVVVWSHVFDFSKLSVFGRHFSRSGAPTADEFRVDSATTTLGTFPFPAVAGDGAEFIVVWMQKDGSDYGVFARRYGASRVPGDVNGDGKVDVADVFQLINFLFAGGQPPK
jgi:hypothetical protein